jgi:hypothetical protein
MHHDEDYGIAHLTHSSEPECMKRAIAVLHWVQETLAPEIGVGATSDE